MYLNAGGRRLARGVKEAGVHGHVAADPTIWGQKTQEISSLKKYSFQSDLIFRSRLVNMVVNRIMKKIIGLSNSLFGHEKYSTKDRNKSTIGFTSSNT